MQDLHNALHWWYIIQHNTVQYSKHNTQYTHSKHDKIDKKHNTTKNNTSLFTKQNVLAVASINTIQDLNKQHTVVAIVQTRCMTCNTTHVHADTMQYLHIEHTEQQNR